MRIISREENCCPFDSNLKMLPLAFPVLTREELEVSLEDELQFLWNEFGEEQTNPLSPDALRLQSELRNRLALHESNS